MYEKLAKWIDWLLKRWLAKSPKVYIIITNIFTVLGIVALIVTIIPSIAPNVILPPWVIAVAAFLIAITSKLTVESPEDDEMDN